MDEVADSISCPISRAVELVSVVLELKALMNCRPLQVEELVTVAYHQALQAGELLVASCGASPAVVVVVVGPVILDLRFVRRYHAPQTGGLVIVKGHCRPRAEKLLPVMSYQAPRMMELELELELTFGASAAGEPVASVFVSLLKFSTY